MKLFITIASIIILLTLTRTSHASNFSLSPSTIAKTELSLRDEVNLQTGCAYPDLSKSINAGTATLNIFLNTDGSTKKIEIENSTGTPEENNIIVSALKTCSFIKQNNKKQKFPTYFYKTVTYKWAAGNNKPRIGLQRCMMRIEYPSQALYRNIEGRVTWGVRPTEGDQFEKKLLLDSGTKILEIYSEREFGNLLRKRVRQMLKKSRDSKVN